MKRYNLVMTMDLWKASQKLAKKRGVSIVSLFRTFIRLGLWIYDIMEDPNSNLIIQEDGKETTVIIV